MKKILADSNVLLDVFNKDENWFVWSSQKLKECASSASLVINPIVFFGVSITFSTVSKLQKVLDKVGFKWMSLSKGICFEAGKAFYRYRKNGGKKLLPLPDFFIGAHAAVAGIPLLTRDVNAYRTYFPNVILIAPH